MTSNNDFSLKLFKIDLKLQKHEVLTKKNWIWFYITGKKRHTHNRIQKLNDSIRIHRICSNNSCVKCNKNECDSNVTKQIQRINRYKNDIDAKNDDM